LEHVSRTQSEFQIAAERYGNQQSPDSLRPHLLEIDARIDGERLHVDWTFSHNVHHSRSVDELSQHFVNALRELLSLPV
jgi:non-ribosomal peptide synthase protein (TIGR01720 family)